MASGEVGRLSVRVLPDTTQFRRDLKKALDRAEKAVTATIDTELRITKASLANVKRQLQGLEATVPVIADLSRESKQRVQDQLDGLDATATVNVDVDHGAASAQVGVFTRPRTLPINVEINPASLAKATAAIAALSGARVLSNFGRSIKNAVANLDQALPALAAGATAISNLSAAALAGTSNLLGIGAGLASIAPAALALPGIFAGFGVGLGVMVAALKDAGEHLGDLGPKFSAIQDKLSTNFWGRVAQPIRDLANNALPMLSARLGEIGGELGGFFASMANSLNTPTNLGFINGILVSVRDSIDIASEGIANFADGLLNLANAGATYLEPLASAFNRMSERFNEWVQVNTDNGQIFEWIDAGVVALQDLGRVLGATGGILAGFATAAANAGGASLGSLADGLENVNKAVNGPAFQGALTTVFQGAHDAMAALGPGVAALGDAFVDFAPALADILVLAGEVGSVGLTAIATAFQNPAFQGGLVAFFEGVLSGVEAIAPHIPALATAFGSVASFAGTLAAVIGPVLGAAIGALAPVVTSLMSGLSALAPVLGGALVTAIQVVAPFIQTIVDAIVGWVQANPGLAATLGVIVAAIGPLIAGAGSLVAALLPVVSSIIGVVTAIAGAGGLSAVIATVSAGLSGFVAAAAPVIAIVAAVAAGLALLVGAFVYAWQTSEQFRNAIMQFGVAIMTALQPVIEFITGTVVPVVQQIAGAFMGAVTQIMTAVTPLMTVIVQIATAILERLTPIIEFIMSVLAPVFTHLGNIVSAAFTFIGTVVSQWINVITSILQVFLALIQGDWAGAWAAVQNVVAVVWQAIQAVIGAAIQLVVTTIQSWLTALQGVWNAIWGAISSFVTSVFARIVGAVTNGINRARSFVQSGLNAIRSVFSSVWNAVVSLVTSVLSRVVSTITNGINRARSMVQSGLNAIRSVFQAVWNAVASLVTSVLSRVVSTITSGISRARSAVQSGMNAVRSTFQSVLNAVVSVVTSTIGRVVSGFRNMMSRAKSTVQGFVSQFTSVGRNLVQGLINGIKNAASGAVSAAKGVVSDAVSGAKSLLGIHSPSRVFAKIGNYTVAGLVKGLNGSAKDAAKASANLANGVVQEFQKKGQLSKKTTLDQLRDRSDRLEKKLRSLKGTAKSTRASRVEIAALGKEIERNDAQIKAVQRGDVKALAQARAEGFFRAYAQTAATQLENLAKTREQLTARLKTANKELEAAIKVRTDYSASMRDKLGSTFELSSESTGMSIGALTENFKSATKSVIALGGKLAKLRKLGLPSGLIDQVAQLGAVDGGKVASNLLKGSKKQLKRLGAWYEQNQRSSSTIGNQLARGMYDSGINAAKGLAKGLTAQLKVVNSAAATLANSVVKTVRKKLKIHSPSRVFMDLGSYTGQGFILGLDGQARGVSAAMSALVEPPSLPTVAGQGGGSAIDPSIGLVDLSSESVEQLADAMLRRPLHIGNRQAGMLSAAGAKTRVSMGGSW